MAILEIPPPDVFTVPVIPVTAGSNVRGGEASSIAYGPAP